MAYDLVPRPSARPGEHIGGLNGMSPFEPNVAPSRDGLFELGVQALGLARRNWWLLALALGAAIGLAIYQARQDRPSYRARAVIQLRDKSGSLASGLSPDVRRGASGADAAL